MNSTSKRRGNTEPVPVYFIVFIQIKAKVKVCNKVANNKNLLLLLRSKISIPGSAIND